LTYIWEQQGFNSGLGGMYDAVAYGLG